jgi:hypothetical protein
MADGGRDGAKIAAVAVDVGDCIQSAAPIGVHTGRRYTALQRTTLSTPIDAASGDQNRHRLSRAGNRRINRALHIMAIVQRRHDTDGRRYYRRRLATGKTAWKVQHGPDDPGGGNPRSGSRLTGGTIPGASQENLKAGVSW